MIRLTAAAMRTPEKGPRKAPNVAAMTRTYLIIVKIIIFDDDDYDDQDDDDDELGDHENHDYDFDHDHNYDDDHDDQAFPTSPNVFQFWTCFVTIRMNG